MPLLRWTWLLALLVLLPLAGRAQVVISQVYGGGGSASGTYTTDYIELHNNSSAPVLLTGYSVQYASAAGTTWTPTALTAVSIPAGGYYLVAESTSAGLAPLPVTANATGSIAMSATAGKVALVNNTTALSGACPTSAAILDLIGYGSTANCFEGAVAPAPSNTTADIRGAGGCTDNNANNTDFATGAPNPRNLSSPASLCPTPVPTIGTISPSSVTAGAAAQTLTVNGTNFISTSVVNFNGTARTTTYVSGTQLTIQLTAADQATAGSYNVTVTNPTPGGGTTTPATFTVNPAATNNPVPTITSLSPSSATAGDPAQTLTVNGTNFISASVVNFNGTARTTTYVSGTQLTIQLTTADLATAGSYDVTVANPTPGGGTTAATTFTVSPVTSNPVPTISSLSPNSATAGAASQTLTVNGTNFISTSVVNFNGTARATTVVSGTQLTIQLTAADQATAGAYNVTVTNPAPGGGTTAPATFTVNPPAPTLTGINPTSIPAGQTTTVTFTGTNFVSGATVNFNGGSVATTFVSSTSLTADIAAPFSSANATFPVSVTVPGGTSGTRTLTVTGTALPVVPTSITAVNTPYAEDFNSLASTSSSNVLPGGWAFVENDTNADAQYTANTGSSTTGDTYSYGATGGTERAFGSLATGSLQSTLGAAYTNNTGTTITSLRIAYTGELWRLGATGGRTDNLAFGYSTGGGTFATATYTAFPALDFTTPNTTGTAGTRDGNQTTNQAALAATISGLSIAPGATFYIHWVDSDISGNDDGLAVDDFSLTANPVAPCNAPTALGTSGISSTGATVSFTGSGTATGYTVTTVPVSTTQTLAGTATSVSFTGLTPGTGYTVSIVSNCAGGATSSAATVGFSTSAAAPALVVTQGGSPVANNGSPSYGFGNQPTGTTQTATFTLTNSGPDPLTISGISATNATVFNFQPFTTPATLAANGGTTTLTVTYTVGTGPQSGTISITSDATNGNASFQLTLTGTGVPVVANPQIAVSQGGTGIANGGSYSGFASTAVGSTSAPVTFSIANASATDNLTLGTFVLTGPFALSGTQPVAVAANGTATFSLTFTPTATGANIGTLTIPNNSQTNNPYVINLGGLGTSATPTDLTVSTTQPIAGSYRNVTVTGTGRALVVGPLVVSGALVIQAGGVLSQNCQTISGPGSFEVQAGALLGICDPAGIYTTGAVGAVQVTGLRTFSPAAGYAYNNPAAAQVTGPGLPAQIFGLGVDNPAGVTLSQGVAVAQQVTLQRGNLNTGGLPFTLLSSAAGTAVVDNTGGVVNGTATVQRYIDNANPVGYRHYSAPVSNTTLSDLATAGFTPTFNTAYNSSPTPGAVRPFPTVFGYDQSRIATVTSNASAFDKGWFSPSANDAMTVNRGYTVNAPNTALVDFVGTLNNGVQSSGVLSRGPDADAGWQFLGNPYPAPLDWSTVTVAQRPGMDAAMYVFQSSGQYGGSYRTYTNGMGTSPLIDAASGYFTRVTTAGTAGAVNLTNTNRVLTFGAQPAFGRGLADTRPQLQLQLRGTTGLDDAYVYFQAGATAGLDADFDAVKLANPTGLNLSSVVGANSTAINGLPLLGSAAVVVPLTVGVPQAGSYSFSAAEVANFTGTVTLLDALSNTRTVLTPGTTYAFTVAGTATTGRFAVEFRPAGVLATTSAQALAAQVQLFPNPASSSFRVQLPVLGSKAVVAATLTNALGQTVLSRSLSAPAGQAIDAEFDVHALAAGVYTLRLTVDSTLLVRKVVVE
ncbi:hypothetical protein GCM10027044_26030 [Hymenobacter ruber]